MYPLATLVESARIYKRFVAGTRGLISTCQHFSSKIKRTPLAVERRWPMRTCAHLILPIVFSHRSSSLMPLAGSSACSRSENAMSLPAHASSRWDQVVLADPRFFSVPINKSLMEELNLENRKFSQPSSQNAHFGNFGSKQSVLYLAKEIRFLHIL
jgi:hypothetical protein